MRKWWGLTVLWDGTQCSSQVGRFLIFCDVVRTCLSGNSVSHGSHYPLDGNWKGKKHWNGKGELPGEKTFSISTRSITRPTRTALGLNTTHRDENLLTDLWVISRPLVDKYNFHGSDGSWVPWKAGNHLPKNTASHLRKSLLFSPCTLMTFVFKRPTRTQLF